MKIVLFISLLSVSLKASNIKVVYGIDNRKDLFEVSNPLYLRLAKSTAGMIEKTRLRYDALNKSYELETKHTLGAAFNLCSSEKFYDQKLTANCSGFLISEDILITAGHCIEGLYDACKKNAWVFDLAMESSTFINTKEIDINNVYSCKKVIHSVLSETQDYAIIQLDRKVVNRKPLKYRESGWISSNANLVTIGHPSMLPTKVADGGKIIENTDRNSFLTNLDTFHGNSGSAVFDAKTGLVEGILVSGKEDYRPSLLFDENSCQVVNVCNIGAGNSCALKNLGKYQPRAEAVMRISLVKKYIK